MLTRAIVLIILLALVLLMMPWGLGKRYTNPPARWHRPRTERLGP